MRLRGRILGTLGSDLGLVMLEGRQYRFSAAEWRSAARPVPGMEVEAVLDDEYRITEIASASEGLPVRRLVMPGGLMRILHRLIPRTNNSKKGERRS